MPCLLHPSPSLQGDVGMGGPHSLLAMYVSAERHMIGTEKETAKKGQHVVDFQTTEIGYLPFIHHRGKTHKELLFSRQQVRTHNVFPFIPQRHIRSCLCSLKNQQRNLGYERNQNSKMMPRRERREKKLILWMNSALRGMVSLVKRIPKEKTCPREKEQLLILVLSEIRRVSFYHRVMKTQ